MKHTICSRLALACALASSTISPVFAFPSTSVKNTVDFTSDVIYQIVTDRFVDGDPSNNPRGERTSKTCKLTHLHCGGDWKGIETKIKDGYLTGMGVSAILISVPAENITTLLPGKSSSYHGYFLRDLKRANPAFGTMAEFKRLIEVAHQHNIKVMIDFVVNQTSPVRAADPTYAENGRLYDDGKLLVSFSKDPGGMYHRRGETDFSNAENMQAKSLGDLADLNQQHPVIDAYLKSAIKVWLDAGIDGIRVDTVKHVPLAWQKTWMQSIYSHRPVYTAGEWYAGRGQRDAAAFDFANNSGMSLLDFTLSQTVREVFRYKDRDMKALIETLEATKTGYRQPLDQITFLDNHDTSRITLSDSAEHHRLMEQALVFSLTSRGTPMIYYGTEQYMVGNGHAPLNRARLTQFDTSTPAYGLIRRLAALRKVSPALQYGVQKHRWMKGDLYIFERSFHGSTVLVAINRSADKSMPVEGLATALRCKDGKPTRYRDVLDELQDGTAITVNCDGAAVAPFTLAPGAIAVWADTDDVPGEVPQLGHVGPRMGLAGEEITLSGRNFGSTPGAVMFDAVRVSGADIVQWEDTLIKVRIPQVGAGRYDVLVERGEQRSEAYGGLEVLAGPQVSLRVIVDDAVVADGDQLFISGPDYSLGGGAAGRAPGPMFNKIIYRYPNWHFDVSVPAGAPLSFHFIRKNARGLLVARESGTPHTFTVPAAGVATVRVKLNGWTAVP